ncbi:hypothetical protein [Actinoplanes auranticolor]|uniref:hypothetical protein n=1 Tax=Actinoplanes auranticolor TaxID=47988 RepID=UPI001BB37A7E|nr:hypothetical protein [Actinoplanes auranticolor]
MDAVEAFMLATRRLDGPRGQRARTLLDSVSLAASLWAYPRSGRDAGMAASLLPTVGVAVERIYTHGLVNGVVAMVAPTATAFTTRRLTRRPTSLADAFTYPAIALTAGAALRLAEQVGQWRLRRGEQNRQDAIRAAMGFFGERQFDRDGGILALDSLQKVFTLLLDSSAVPDHAKAGLMAAQRNRRQRTNSADNQRGHQGGAGTLLAAALHQYADDRGGNRLRDRVYLDREAPAHDARTEEGGLLLDPVQAEELYLVLDEIGVAGDTRLDVVRTLRRGAGMDLSMRVTTQRRGEQARAYDVHLPSGRSVWRLDLVTVGLALQSAWIMTTSSPGHAHIPVPVTAAAAAVDAVAAATAHYISRRWQSVNPSDLTLLCLPASLFIATVGTRTMRRKTYNPGGTPMHPGLHALAGNAWVLGSHARRMSPVGKALLVAGVGLQIGTSWLMSRRQPGDGKAFLAEMTWATLAMAGSLVLSRGLARMEQRTSIEQEERAAEVAGLAFRTGWAGRRQTIGAQVDQAADLLLQAERQADVPSADPRTLENYKMLTLLNEDARSALEDAGQRRPSATATRTESRR